MSPSQDALPMSLDLTAEEIKVAIEAIAFRAKRIRKNLDENKQPLQEAAKNALDFKLLNGLLKKLIRSWHSEPVTRQGARRINLNCRCHKKATVSQQAANLDPTPQSNAAIPRPHPATAFPNAPIATPVALRRRRTNPLATHATVSCARGCG